MMNVVFSIMSNVQTIGSNFESKMQHQGKPTFVMFYTPWCEHYLSFKSGWETFLMDGVDFAQVNCVDNRDVC